VIIETIGVVTTTTELTVRAALDTDTYPKGIRIPDQEMKARCGTRPDDWTARAE